MDWDSDWIRDFLSDYKVRLSIMTHTFFSCARGVEECRLPSVMAGQLVGSGWAPDYPGIHCEILSKISIDEQNSKLKRIYC